MSYWQLYWLTRLDEFKCFFSGLSVFCFFSAIGVIVLKWIKYEYDSPYATEKITWEKYKLELTFLVVGTSFWIISSFIPSTKDIALMYSGHFATHSEEMKKLPDNLLRYLNTFLEKEEKK